LFFIGFFVDLESPPGSFGLRVTMIADCGKVLFQLPGARVCTASCCVTF